MNFTIRAAEEKDVPQILGFIRELAEYERLAHEVIATDAILQQSLFGNAPKANVIFGCVENEPVAFAVFFYNFSTFLGRPGIYLEDLYVKPPFRRRGIARSMIHFLARLAKEQNCGRFEWSVLDWNETAIEFYRSLGAVGLNDWTVFRVTGDALDRLATIEPRDTESKSTS